MPERSEFLHKTLIITLVVLPLLGTLTAIYYTWNQYVFWQDIAILLGMYAVTTMGVTIGYHRMLTHKGFDAPEWLRGLVLICGAMAYEGQPLSWTATHIKHHAHSDEEGDPHSPLDGFWHAHFGWLFSLNNFPKVKEYAPQLLEDKTAVWVDTYTLIWMGLALAIPFALGGWTGLIWGGAVRIFLTTHITWSVNSVCHTFGKRDFETTDASRNNWLIGLLGFGEGWHNNHHAFPNSAFHGLKWYQFDMSGIVIRTLEVVGLIWNVERVSEAAFIAQKQRVETMREAATRIRKDMYRRIANAKKELFESLEQRLDQTINERELLTATKQCEHAAARLEEIQKRIARAKNLKRQKILAYQREVGELIQNTRKSLVPTT